MYCISTDDTQPYVNQSINQVPCFCGVDDHDCTLDSLSALVTRPTPNHFLSHSTYFLPFFPLLLLPPIIPLLQDVPVYICCSNEVRYSFLITRKHFFNRAHTVNLLTGTSKSGISLRNEKSTRW